MAKRHTAEEIIWGQEKLKQLKGSLNEKVIRSMGIYDEYIKKINPSASMSSLMVWLRRIRNPNDYASMRNASKREYKSKKNVSSSNYLVCISGNVAGFDNEDEVKEFLISSQILSGVVVFKRIDVDVKYQIKLG